MNEKQTHQPSPAQVRAARALLNWSQQELAANSGIGRRTIAAYETGSDKTTSASILEMTLALEAAGIRFSEDGPEGVHRIEF